MKLPKFLVFAFWVCVLLLLAGGLSILIDANAAQEPYAIDLDKDVEVEIQKPSIYAVQVEFSQGKLNSTELGLILGSSHKNEKGAWVEPGVPASYRVIVKDKAGHTFLNQVIKRPPTMAMYQGRYANLVILPLSKDNYVVRVEVLETSTEVAELNKDYFLAKAHPGK